MTLTTFKRATLQNMPGGLTRRERNMLTGGYVASGDNVWWNGTDLTRRGTTVTVTGSQTITENASPYPYLNVTSISSISANDLNSVLFPATLAAGQRWRCNVRAQTSSTTGVFLMASLLFTDGTTSSANMAANVAYHNTSGTHICQGWGGTLTATSGITTGIASSYAALAQNSLMMLELEYVSSNTFSQRLYSADGHSLIFEQTSWSRTITPTHVGVAWSNYGTSPTSPSCEFGPIYRAA